MKVRRSKIPKPVNPDTNCDLSLLIVLCQQAKQETKDEVEKRSKLVTMTWQGDRDLPEIISLPVPYQLPPKPYSPEDVPWSWDRGYSKKDVYGQVWPR
jgi:tyrosyl-DNA phosphodiesterase-1